MMLSCMAAQQAIQRQRHEIDAKDVPLGRLATRVAVLLRGKQRATFAPHIDAGDYVHVTNARAVYFSGRKLTGKRYHQFSGYPGGLRTTTLQARRVKDPTGIIRDAVFGMLPRNRQRARMLRRLTIDA